MRACDSHRRHFIVGWGHYRYSEYRRYMQSATAFDAVGFLVKFGNRLPNAYAGFRFIVEPLLIIIRRSVLAGVVRLPPTRVGANVDFLLH